MAKSLLISVIFLIYFFNVIFAQFTPALTVLDNFNLTTTCKTSIASLIDDKSINKCLPMFTIITSIPPLLAPTQKDPKVKLDIFSQIVKQTCSLSKCSPSLAQNTTLSLKESCSQDLLQQNIMATLNFLLFAHYKPIQELTCKRNRSSQFNSYCILETLTNIGIYNTKSSKRHEHNPKAANDNNTPPQGGDDAPPQGGDDTPPQGGDDTPPQDDGKAPPQDGGKTPPQDDGKAPPQDGGKTPPQDDGKAPPQDDGKAPPQDDGKAPPQGGDSTPPQDGGKAPTQSTPPQGSDNVPWPGSESAPTPSTPSTPLFIKTLEAMPNSLVCTDCNKAMTSVVLNYLKENPKALNEILQQITIKQGSQALELKCGSSFLDGTTPTTISSSPKLLNSYFYNFIGIFIITISLLL